MILNIESNGKTLIEASNVKISDFTVLTGENGSGKTQLLTWLNDSQTIDRTQWDENNNDFIPEFLPPISDDQGNPLTNFIYSEPGLKFKHPDTIHYYNSTSIEQIKTDWRNLRGIPSVLHALRHKTFGSPTEEAEAVNTEFSELFESYYSNSNGGKPEARKINSEHIKRLRVLSETCDKPDSEVTFIDFLTFYPVHNKLFSPSLDLVFHQYHLLSKHYETRVEGKRSPWDELNAIFEESNFNYLIVYKPSDNEEVLSVAKLVNKEDYLKGISTEIYFSQLSPGELTVMNLIFALYNLSSGGVFPDVLLLDEPDAHLHPSFAHTLVNVLERLALHEKKIKVIMSTHSATTVALAPADSIYEMSRNEPQIRKSPSKNHSVTRLTSGLIYVGDGAKYFLVEDKDDVEFYTYVKDELVRSQKLDSNRAMVFIPASTKLRSQKNDETGGKNMVEGWVAKLRNSGLTGIMHGLIDRDNGNTGTHDIFVIDRYNYENYLADPIIAYAALMDRGKNEVIEIAPLHIGDENKILSLGSEALQLIVDSVLSKVDPTNIKNFSTKDLELVDVEYINGTVVKYPKWLLNRDGKDVISQGYIKVEEYSKVINKTSLLQAFKRVKLFPKDLSDKFNEMIKN